MGELSFELPGLYQSNYPLLKLPSPGMYYVENPCNRIGLLPGNFNTSIVDHCTPDIVLSIAHPSRFTRAGQAGDSNRTAWQ